MNYDSRHKADVVAIVEYLRCLDRLRVNLRSRTHDIIDDVRESFPQILNDAKRARQDLTTLIEILEDYDYDRIIETYTTQYDGENL